MRIPEKLTELLEANCIVRSVDDGIYSVLADASARRHYDRRAAVYDFVVSTHVYNSVMWGSSPSQYVDFAREAVGACKGTFLDAGCGSLLFTAAAYANEEQTIIACDQSLSMLKRGRKRLLKLFGKVPAHIVLLQADLSDLPFRPGTFDSVLCLNVLHLFADGAALVSDLKQLLMPQGRLCLTSLVSTGRWPGDRYLKALYAAGEFVCPRSNIEFRELVERALGQNVSFFVKGNMAFVAMTASR